MNKFYSFEGNFKKYRANNNLEDLTNWAKAIIQHRMENATTLEGFEIAVEGNEAIKSEDTYVIGKYVSKYITDTFQATGKVIDHDFKLVDIWTGDMTKEDVLALSFNDALQLSDEVVEYQDRYFDYYTNNAILKWNQPTYTSNLYRWSDLVY
tara:strand:- start:7529 stop:7984 length:456 start_codon:yes stop_codon:yes gene_type:complete